jgi:hypothetical protein
MAYFLNFVNGFISRIAALTVSAGSADADKLAATSSNGKLDNSLINWDAPSAIGSTTANTIRCSQFTVAGASGSTKDVRWFSTGALWNLYANNTAEVGNAGSDLVLSRYGGGSYLGDIFQVLRNTGAMTFYTSCAFNSGLSSAGSISVTGSQIALAPVTPSAGGGFRYDYTAAASIALVSVGGGSNLQFGHSAPATPYSTIFNSGSPLCFQVNTSGVAQGYVLIGVSTAFSSTDRLQVSGNIAASGNVSIGGTLKVGSNGSTITRVLLASSSALDTVSVAAQSSTTITVTVTGATIGDQVNVNASSATPNTNFSLHGYVSAANTVTVVAYNRAATSQSFSGNVKVSVIG